MSSLRNTLPLLSAWNPQKQLLRPALCFINSVRCVHSERQIKRLFKNNSARARIEKRMNIDRTPLPLDPPTFAPVFTDFNLLPNGWSAPPGPNVAIPQYPFSILRTKNKPNDAVGFLPIYSKLRKDGTKTTTRIKKVKGDQEAFLRELRAVLQLPAPASGRASDDNIRTRFGGVIEVDGNYVRKVKLWLAGLGF